MKKLQQIAKMSIAIAFVLTSLTTSARGDVVGGSLGFGPGGSQTVQIRGSIVCAGCSLEEMHKANPQEYPFYYQLSHKNERLVMHIDWVSDTAQWSRVVWPPRLSVRGEEGVLQQLGAEANLFKNIAITAILSNTRALDILNVTRTD